MKLSKDAKLLLSNNISADDQRITKKKKIMAVYFLCVCVLVYAVPLLLNTNRMTYKRTNI